MIARGQLEVATLECRRVPKQHLKEGEAYTMRRI